MSMKVKLALILGVISLTIVALMGYVAYEKSANHIKVLIQRESMDTLRKIAMLPSMISHIYMRHNKIFAEATAEDLRRFLDFAYTVSTFDFIDSKSRLISLLKKLDVKGGGFFIVDSSGSLAWKSRGAQSLLTPDLDLSALFLTCEGWQRYPFGEKSRVMAWKSLGKWGWILGIIAIPEEFSSFPERKFLNSMRAAFLSILKSFSFGKRGYIEIFSPDGKLIFSSKTSLGPDDAPDSPFIKKALANTNGTFFYTWDGEKKLRASLRIKVPWASRGRMLVLTGYVSDFIGSFFSSLMTRLAVLGVALFLGLFFLIYFYLNGKVFSIFPVVLEGIDSFMRGDYRYRLKKVGEPEMDEIIDKFNALGESLGFQRNELESTYEELSAMNLELARGREELEATYSQLKAYASTLEKLNLELSRSNEILRMVFSASEKLLIVSETEEPWESIYGVLKRFYEDADLGIYELSDDEKWLIRRAGSGEDRIPAEKGVWEGVIKDGKPVMLSETEGEFGVSGITKLMVPIKFRERVYGLILLVSKKEDLLTQIDLELISILANLVGVSMANRRYFSSALRKTKRLKALAEVSELIASSVNLRSDLDKIVKAIAERLGFDSFEILFKEGDRLKRASGVGNILSVNYGDEGWDVSKGITGWVARHGRGAFVPDVSKDLRYVGLLEGVRSEIVVPIEGDGKVYGVINVESKHELTFDDYEVLSVLGRHLGIALRKEEIFRDAAEEACRFKFLYEIALRLGRLDPLEKVVNEVFGKIRAERGLISVGVLLFNKLAGRLKRWAGNSGPFKPKRDIYELLRSGKGVTFKAFSENRIINVPDVSKEPSYLEAFEETKSELAIPVRFGEEVLGVLNIESPRINDFSKKDEEFFESLANLVGLAVAREQVMMDLKHQTERLKALVSTSQGVFSIHDKDELYKFICELLSSELSYTIVAYYEADFERGYMVFKAGSGLFEEMPESARYLKIGEEGVVGYVASTGEMLNLPDVRSDPRYFKVSDLILSALVVPVKLNGKVVGVIDIEDYLPNAFSSIDEDVVSSIANLLSIALSHIEYQRSLERKKKRLELLHVLSMRLSNVETEEEIESTVVKFLAEYMRYPYVSFQKAVGDKLILSKVYPERSWKLPEVKLGEGITGWAALHKETVLVDDVSKDPRYIERTPDVKSELATPIIRRGEVYGVLNLESDQKGAFVDDDRWLLEAVASSVGVALERMGFVKELKENLFATTLALAKTIELKDPYTRGHCERVMRYSDKLAERLGMSDEERERLRYAAILHDIGKIGVPGRVLNKPGRLTDEEFEMVKKHATLGEETLKDVPFFKDIAPFVRWHHERWDGKGYPDGLKEYEIPLEDRIMSIADAYDAMTSDRPYRKALPREVAMREIEEGKGKQFDPLLAEEFLKMLKEGDVDEDRSE